MTVLHMPIILVKGAVKDANNFESDVQHVVSSVQLERVNQLC